MTLLIATALGGAEKQVALILVGETVLMKPSKPVVLPDALDPLREFVRRGRIFEVQKWITEGKPIFTPGHRRRDVLASAIHTGFHSMVEVLSDAWTDSASLTDAARLACEHRRADLVEILRLRGADMTKIHLSVIAMTCDKELMKYVFDHWDQFDRPDALFDIVTSMPRPLIGLIREYRSQLPDSDAQLGKSLKFFIEENHSLWVALTIWMGADPRRPCPWHRDNKESPEEWTTPVEDAVVWGNLQALKTMKVSPVSDDIDALFKKASGHRSTEMEVPEFLLGLGAKINNNSNGGSRILEQLLAPIGVLDHTYINTHALREWIRRGARLQPDEQTDYRYIRKGICSMGSFGLDDLLKILIQAAADETLVHIFDTPKLRGLLKVKTKAELEYRIQTIRRREHVKEHGIPIPPQPKVTVFRQKAVPFVGVTNAVFLRGALFDLMWTEQLKEIAISCCVLPNVITRACLQFRIPTPPPGFWIQKKYKDRGNLPSLGEPLWNPEIRLCEFQHGPSLRVDENRKELNELIKRLSKPDIAVVVPMPASHIHPLIGNLKINVRQELKPRAESVLSALLFFLEENGFALQTHEGFGRGELQAKLFGYGVPFGMNDESARLRLFISEYPWRSRTSWADGHRYFVENYFAEFCATAAYIAAAKSETQSNK